MEFAYTGRIWDNMKYGRPAAMPLSLCLSGFLIICGKKVFMKNQKRILALIGIILILGMYILTFVLAFMKSPRAQTAFRGALGCTILVPVFLYLIQMVARVLRPDKSAAVDTVIFDVGNVLLDFPWQTCCENMDLPKEDYAAVGKKVLYSPLWHKLDLGNDSYESVTAEFVAIDPSRADTIRRIVNEVDEYVTPFWYTDDLIRTLKRQGYRVYFLSNWSERWYEDCAKRGVMDFEKRMDGGIWSYRVHLAKPDPEIYRKLFRTYGIDPSRALFIDDTEENVEAARNLGCSGFVFTEYNDMAEKLRSVGVKIS